MSAEEIPLRPDQQREPSVLTKDNYWAQIPEWVLFHDSLSVGARCLYGVLDRFANDRNVAWPGQPRLAKLLHVTDRQVRRYITELEEVGALTVAQRKGGSNLYRLISQPPRGAVDIAVDESPVDPTPGHTCPATPDTDVRTPGHTCPPPRTQVSYEPEPLNQSQKSSSRGRTCPTPSEADDDDLGRRLDVVVEVSRIAAQAALDAREAARLAGRPLDPIGNPQVWLRRTAANWADWNGELTLTLAADRPELDAVHLAALLLGAPTPIPSGDAARTVEVVWAPCGACDAGWLFTDDGDVTRCACTTDLSAGNLPQGATA